MSRTSLTLALSICFLAGLLGRPDLAAAQTPTGSTRALGMSNAIHSISSGTMAPHGNPAGMSMVYQYMVEGSYGFVHESNDSRAGISVIDSSTNPGFALGGSYLYQGGAVSGDVDGHWHRLNVGGSTGYQSGSVGVYFGGLYHYQHDAMADTHDGTFGMILSVQRMISLGVVGHNVFNPRAEPGRTRMLSSGVSIGREQFILAFDTTVDFSSREKATMIYRGAAEVFLAGVAGLRAGYAFDRVRDDRHSFSMGLGFIFQFAGIEFAYEQNPQVGRDNLFMGSVVLYVP